MAIVWSEERMVLLQSLIDDNVPVDKIASTLGMSGDAVRSKIRRINESSKPQQRSKTDTYDARRCRWPIGHPPDDDFQFCKRRAEVGRSYCTEHAAVAYNKNSTVMRKMKTYA